MGQGFLTNRSHMSPLEGGVEENYPELIDWEIGFGWDINFGDWVFYGDGLNFSNKYAFGAKIGDAPRIVVLSSTRLVTINIGVEPPINTAIFQPSKTTFSLYDISNGIILLDTIYIETGLDLHRVDYMTWSPPGGAKINEDTFVALTKIDWYKNIENGAGRIYLVSAKNDRLTLLDTSIVGKKSLDIEHNYMELCDMLKISNSKFAIAYSYSRGSGSWPNHVESDSTRVCLFETAAGMLQKIDEVEIMPMWAISLDLSWINLFLLLAFIYTSLICHSYLNT